MKKLVFKEGREVDLLNLVIPGERVVLSSVSDKYVETMFREFDDETTRYMRPSANETIEQAMEFIDSSRKEMKHGEGFVFSIENKATGEYLGNGGLVTSSYPAATPEFGIWIKKGAHGNKYGREAIHTMYKWACENLVCDYFVYPVAKENIPSRKIPESLGGVVFKEDSFTKTDGRVVDCVVYRIELVR